MEDNDVHKIEAAVGAKLAKHFDDVKGTMKAYEDGLAANGRVAEGLKDKIAELNTTGAKLVAEQTELQGKNDARMLSLEQKLAAADADKATRPGSSVQQKSIGQTFIESDQWKAVASKAARGERFFMDPVSIKNIISISGSGGAGIFPEYLPTPVIPAFQPLTVRDLLGHGTTNSNSIIWVQEGVFTNQAGYQGSDGNLKPQSDITYTQVTIHAATIAHYMRASKQVLADFPLLQSLINSRLSFGLKLKEEQEILFGDGATNHLHGLVPQASAYNTAYTRGGDTMVDVIRHAMLQVTMAFYPATGVCLSPTDWHDIELLKDTLHRYLFANPQGVAPAMIWGLPVAQCYSMGIGDFLVGSFKLAATLFDRQEATILVSTEDQDNFIRNLVTILAEERLMLGVSRPAAIVWGGFGAGTSGPTG